MPASVNYLFPVDLLTIYDSRRVLQLASDTGTVATAANLADTASTPYAIVLNAIRAAASDLDSHCQMGKRYTRSTLETFISEAVAAPTDETKQKRAGLVRQLVADLAFGILASRRGYTGDSLKAWAPRYETALVTLERLSQGFQIFDTDDAIASGVPSQVSIGVNVYRPSVNNRLFGIFPNGSNPFGPNYGRW